MKAVQAKAQAEASAIAELDTAIDAVAFAYRRYIQAKAWGDGGVAIAQRRGEWEHTERLVRRAVARRWAAKAKDTPK